MLVRVEAVDVSLNDQICGSVALAGLLPTERLGLAKFDATQAEFRNFALAPA